MEQFRKYIEWVLILFGIFLNFFGREVSSYIGQTFFDLPNIRLIPINKFYEESIFEMEIVYSIIFTGALILFFATRKAKEPKNKIYSTNKQFDFFLKAVIIGFVLLFFSEINWSFNVSERGVDQFQRDLGGVLKRLKLLFFPVFVYYLVINKKKSRVLIVSIFIVIGLYTVSTAGRREIMYLFIIIILYYYGQGEIPPKQLKKMRLIFPLIIGVAFLSNMLRSGKEIEGVNYGLFVAAAGILGGIGTNAILWQVKEFVAYKTGLLFGSTFLTYIKIIFIPSFLLLALQGNEYVPRGAFLFNEYYNTSENMGYDFMMIADFYWNFGYLGYLLFILIILGIIYLVKQWKTSKSPILRALSILIVMYLIVGQRSDFGFFLKNVVYNAVILIFLDYARRIKFTSQKKSNSTVN